MEVLLFAHLVCRVPFSPTAPARLTCAPVLMKVPDDGKSKWGLVGVEPGGAAGATTTPATLSDQSSLAWRGKVGG